MIRLEGLVRSVQFQPMGEWFLSVQLDGRFAEERHGWHQIDDAKYFVNGAEMEKLRLLEWLVGQSRGKALPAVVLSITPGVYGSCERAEFTERKRDDG